MARRKLWSQEVLDELDSRFTVDLKTGVVYRDGKVMKFHIRNGYPAFHVGKRQVQVHQVVWYFKTGKQPEGLLDHKDGNPLNNAGENIREATDQQNNFNASKQSNNTSGFKGVTWNKQKQKWRTQIQFDGHNMHVGYFTNLDDAVAAYDQKARELHGDFARVNVV